MPGRQVLGVLQGIGFAGEEIAEIYQGAVKVHRADGLIHDQLHMNGLGDAVWVVPFFPGNSSGFGNLLECLVNVRRVSYPIAAVFCGRNLNAHPALTLQELVFCRFQVAFRDHHLKVATDCHGDFDVGPEMGVIARRVMRV